MAGHEKLTCLACGQANRTAVGRAAPKCGVCGAPLAAGRVAELDIPTLERAIRTDDRPLMVDFWAPWCGPCRTMAPEFAKAAGMLAPAVRLARIDTEAHPRCGARFGIRGIPLLILFDQGQEVARLAGARPAAEIATFARERPGARSVA